MSETKLTPDDLTNLGAALENYVTGEATAAEEKSAAETAARKRLKGHPTDVSWWGATPPAERGSGPRPGCTYRAARRNIARAEGWPKGK